MNLLEVDGVDLSFGNRKILSHVYLSCETGEVIGLIGRNGSGKSSLLKVIFGTLTGAHQSVRLNRQYVKKLHQVSQSINFVTQEGVLMSYLTLDDLIKIFHLRKYEAELLAIDEIKRERFTRLGALSGGTRKLIEITVHLYADTMFTLLDEPFSYLSPVLVETLLPIIQQRSRVKGIILTDHQYQTVWSVSSRRLVLYDGIVQEVKEQEELEQYGYLSF
ncbi:MAG: ATP-binding cassette domain-containing protein [Cyclobacteriaceae bacterium]|nr:ATP-binding cassette domain-containing protein [Cyclobacteriaceae bacterium HetDA_MAG_MS6]